MNHESYETETYETETLSPMALDPCKDEIIANITLWYDTPLVTQVSADSSQLLHTIRNNSAQNLFQSVGA